jgi:hypothetical protein
LLSWEMLGIALLLGPLILSSVSLIAWILYTTFKESMEHRRVVVRTFDLNNGVKQYLAGIKQDLKRCIMLIEKERILRNNAI